MRTRLVGFLFVLGMALVGTAVAGLNANWSTHADGIARGSAEGHERAESGDLPPLEGQIGARVQADRVEHRERHRRSHPRGRVRRQRAHRGVPLRGGRAWCRPNGRSSRRGHDHGGESHRAAYWDEPRRADIADGLRRRVRERPHERRSGSDQHRAGGLPGRRSPRRHQVTRERGKGGARRAGRRPALPL